MATLGTRSPTPSSILSRRPHTGRHATLRRITRSSCGRHYLRTGALVYRCLCHCRGGLWNISRTPHAVCCCWQMVRTCRRSRNGQGLNPPIVASCSVCWHEQTKGSWTTSPIFTVDTSSRLEPSAENPWIAARQVIFGGNIGNGEKHNRRKREARLRRRANSLDSGTRVRTFPRIPVTHFKSSGQLAITSGCVAKAGPTWKRSTPPRKHWDANQRK